MLISSQIRRKFFHRLMALLVALNIGAVSHAAPAPVPASADERSVRDTVNGFAREWNKHDMVAFGKLFAPDADFVTVSGTWMKGRNAIYLGHAFLHAAIPQGSLFPEHARQYGLFKNSTMSFVQTDVRFLRPDVALAHVSWQLTGDPRIPLRKGLFTFVLTKQSGRWLIASGQNTEINRTVH
jgi:uncharacterized protein (TIGR02246 family)